MFCGSSALLVFTKIPGRAPVKTRLAQTAGLQQPQLEQVARALLHDTLRAAAASTTGPLLLATDPEITKEALADQLALIPGCRLGSSLPCAIFPQRGNGFAARLEAAVNEAFDRAAGGVVLIGSDAPLLPSTLFERALEAVEAGRFCLGPTPMGGFYLLGIPRAARERFSIERTFLEYSEGTELESVCREIAQSGLPLDLLELHCDIDVADDLVTLISLGAALEQASSAHSFASPDATLAVLRELGIQTRQSAADTRKLTVSVAGA